MSDGQTKNRQEEATEMESQPQPIGQTSAVKKYQMNPKLSMHDTTPGRLLKKPPAIKPEEFPNQTMRRIFKCSSLEMSLDYDVMKGHLLSYYKHGDSRKWEDYRVKIAPPLLEIWKAAMIECRRNGFINPHIRGGEIVFDQVTSTSSYGSADLCTMCDRECKRREAIETGDVKRRRGLDKGYQEPKPCWDKARGLIAHGMAVEIVGRQPGEDDA
jgi:hypothetical protein